MLLTGLDPCKIRIAIPSISCKIKSKGCECLMDHKLELLNKYFGYTSFRSGQEPLIDALLTGRDVFGIMPTGGGKSLCYQIPALMLDGITLVVSPLISLMKDQVMALKDSGISAAYINSSLTYEQIRLVYRNLAFGQYKIIYIAPERLLTDGFLNAIGQIKIAMLAVDEAHCISQWGQDFRPSYLRITEFLNLLPCRPIVSAFTATATSAVQEDVIQLLGLKDPLVLVTGFDRPNLRFEVLKPKNKPDALCRLLSARMRKCGIVYCSTRKDVEKVCALLQARNFSATRYHAGLSDEERHNNQDDFVYDRCNIIVATNAFGMGINKSNVSFVIHYNMPQSMEAYYQEAGRAGRDGSPADCILLYSAGDIQTAKFLILHPNENELLSEAEQQHVQNRDLKRLDKMISYCKTDTCLRGVILDYFGETHQSTCDNCSNCDTDAVKTDITTQAQMILSCIQQIYRKLGYYIGATMVVRTLHGSTEMRIMNLKLNTLSTYGLLSKTSRTDIQSMLEALESQGYLRTNPEYGSIYPTEKAKGILFGNATVYMRTPKTTTKSKQVIPSTQPDSDLLSVLKALRFRLAKKANVPAYIVFSNATLEDMAAKIPQTMDAFLNVSGVGNHKAERYGEAFLAEINNYLKTNSDA